MQQVRQPSEDCQKGCRDHHACGDACASASAVPMSTVSTRHDHREACSDLGVNDDAPQAIGVSFHASTHTLVPPRLMPKWAWEAMAEWFGTLLMCLVGLGVVATAVTTGAQSGIWQVAVVWGLAVTLSIIAVGPISGAHLNPAVTLSLVLWRPKDFRPTILLWYIPAQFIGAFCAALIVYGLWQSPIAYFEFQHNITRSLVGSGERSGAIFCECFPNPGAGLPVEVVSPGLAFGMELLGTGILMMIILVLTDFRNVSYQHAVAKGMTPFWIGSMLACLISLFGPFTMAGFNPARDFAPRLVALIFGWGAIAIPGLQNGFWVYLLAPCVGALAAGLVYKLTIGRHFKEQCLQGKCDCKR
jgi:glycerol uptake facilitator protein